MKKIARRSPGKRAYSLSESSQEREFWRPIFLRFINFFATSGHKKLDSVESDATFQKKTEPKTRFHRIFSVNFQKEGWVIAHLRTGWVGSFFSAADGIAGLPNVSTITLFV